MSRMQASLTNRANKSQLYDHTRTMYIKFVVCFLNITSSSHIYDMFAQKPERRSYEKKKLNRHNHIAYHEGLQIPETV